MLIVRSSSVDIAKCWIARPTHLATSEITSLDGNNHSIASQLLPKLSGSSSEVPFTSLCPDGTFPTEARSHNQLSDRVVQVYIDLNPVQFVRKEICQSYAVISGNTVALQKWLAQHHVQRGATHRIRSHRTKDPM